MEIDLGSVAKGYTGDRVIELLRENGVTSALLNLGGNVQALGTKPDGSPWRVAVQDPSGDGCLGVLEIDDQAVITSGGYERYFVEDGVTYWHIIDPADGAPARSGLISVTIVGDSGLLCDGLSTSLFVMGLEDAAQFWRENGGFEAVFVTESGQILITEGLQERFSLLEDTEDPIVVIHHD
jgi:thiamine biosynthesis lipoprotein